MNVLISIKAEHATDLFPIVFKTKVTETILWDGPESMEDFHQSLDERERIMNAGEIHMFTIKEPVTGKLVGCADIRPYKNKKEADVGLWIGESFQGKGLGTLAIKDLINYGFNILKLESIESFVFTNNIASRRIFENVDLFLKEQCLRK